jgi:hypothetical protein
MKLNDLFEMAADSFTKIRKIFQSNFERRKLQFDLPVHAFERSVEGERGQNVTEEHLITALQQMLKRYDQKDPELMKAFSAAEENKASGAQVTFRFPVEDTFLNFPCVIKALGGNRFKFTVKTVMVKREFKPYKTDIIVNL